MPEKKNPVDTFQKNLAGFFDAREEEWVNDVYNLKDYQEAIARLEDLRVHLDNLFTELIQDETKRENCQKIIMDISDQYSVLTSITCSHVFRGGVKDGTFLTVTVLSHVLSNRMPEIA